MSLDPKPWHFYMSALTIFNLLIFATPLLVIYAEPAGNFLFTAFSYTCHQLASRSYCFYSADGAIGDCPALHARAPVLDSEKGPAYEFPVCARDIAIYLGAWLSGLAVYFTKWKGAKNTPNPIFFILALIPIGLDGGTQLLGWRESTNELRLITGLIAGLAFSFYFVPMLNAILLKGSRESGRKNPEEGHKEEKTPEKGKPEKPKEKEEPGRKKK